LPGTIERGQHLTLFAGHDRRKELAGFDGAGFMDDGPCSSREMIDEA
jgi:hypothetical protein